MIGLQILEVLSDGSGNLAEVAHTAQVETYCKVALACVLLYHALTTMDCEVKFFWSSLRFSPANFVYFLNRYVGLFSIFISIQLHLFNVSASRCAVVTWLHNVADWATVLLIDYILLLGVLALYSRRRCLSIGLHLFVLWEASMRLAVMIVATKAELAQQKLLSTRTACIEQNKCMRRTEEILYCRIAPLVYQSVLLVLALKKAITYWKEMGLGSHLVTVLVQGHIAYFVMALSCSLMNILKCYLADHLFWKGMATTLGSPSLLCLLGSHMMFDIKIAGEKGLNEVSRSFSNVEFAHGATAKDARSAQMSPRAVTNTDITQAELRTFERDRKGGPNSQISSTMSGDTEDTMPPTYWDERRTDRATILPMPLMTFSDVESTQSTIALPEQIASAVTYYPRGRAINPADERFSRNPFV